MAAEHDDLTLNDGHDHSLTAHLDVKLGTERDEIGTPSRHPKAPARIVRDLEERLSPGNLDQALCAAKADPDSGLRVELNRRTVCEPQRAVLAMGGRVRSAQTEEVSTARGRQHNGGRSWHRGRR